MSDDQLKADSAAVLEPGSPELGIEVVEESPPSADANTGDQENSMDIEGDIGTEDTAEEPADINEAGSKPSSSTGASDRSLSLNLPLSKIRLIMKTDPDVAICSADSAFLITRCTELFMKHLAGEAYKSTKAANRKTVQRKDVDDAIQGVDQFFFLDGAL